MPILGLSCGDDMVPNEQVVGLEHRSNSVGDLKGQVAKHPHLLRQYGMLRKSTMLQALRLGRALGLMHCKGRTG